MSGTTNRRQFLGQTAAGSAAGLVLGSSLLNAADTPSKRVVVGIMGLSRGKSLTDTFARQAGVEVRYVCDTDKDRAASGVAVVEKAGGKAPQVIGDFRRILDDKEVDVLVCAAPNHWHAPATILGCSAGKHVYVEKPCCHNPAEGEMMVESSRKYRRAVQMGSQRRSGPTYIEAIDLVRNGTIGNVYLARSWYENLRPSLGRAKSASAPANFDYELWQGPAPRVPYVEFNDSGSFSRHYNWHWFWHWGNGELGNNGIHALDVCRWGLGVDYPVRVTSSGGRYAFDDDQQTPDTHTVCYEFANKKQITWQGLSCNKHGGGFVTFYGDKGTLALDASGGYTIFDAKGKETKKVPGVMKDDFHIANFVAAIRDDKPLSCNAEILEGFKSTLLCHLGNIAQRTGRTMNCSPTNGHIIGDEKAMAYWSREYEKGWEPRV